MTNPEDAWCDWCGKANLGTAFRYDERVFCSFSCVRRYQTQQVTPKVTDLNEWVERSSSSSSCRDDGPPSPA